MRQTKQVFRELILGLAVWSLVMALTLTMIATHRLAMLAGVAAGGLTAGGLLWHMYRHLDIALDMDEKHAQSHTQFSAAKRTLFMAAVLALSLVWPQYLHPVGVVAGLFGMKITALLYPIWHKCLKKIKNKKKRYGV